MSMETGAVRRISQGLQIRHDEPKAALFASLRIALAAAKGDAKLLFKVSPYNL
jgi:hypothetical protein